MIPGWGHKWDALKLTYAKSDDVSPEVGYHEMPWTVKEATEKDKWMKIDEDRTLNVDIFSQPEDPRVLLMYDHNGNIAGLRMSFIKEDVYKQSLTGGYTFDFDYDTNPMYEKGKYFGKDLWYTSILFVSPETLAKGGRHFLNKETDEIAEGIWFKPEGKWVEVTKEECQISKEFSSQECIEGMGKHYFYKLDGNDCKNSRPFAAIYDHGKLAGVLLLGFGSFSTPSGTQNYFEDFSIKDHITEDQKCLNEYIEKYGITKMHVFLTKGASTTTCPSQEWRSLHC